MSETQTPVDEGFMREFKDLQRKIADIANASVGGAQFATGDVIWSAGTTRAGAVLMDGTSYLDADPIIGAALGALLRASGFVTDGTHVFVPDARGRTLVAAGSGAGLTVRAIADAFGVETVTLTGAQSGTSAHAHPAPTITIGNEAAHTHTGTTGNDSPDHTHSFLNTDGVGRALAGAAWAVYTGTSVNTGGASARHTHAFTSNAGSSHTHTGTSGAIANSTTANAGSSHTNTQPSLVLNAFLKT